MITMEPAGRRFCYDHALVASIIILVGVGFVTLYSASYSYAGLFYGAPYYFISRQAKFGVIGLLLFFLGSRISMEAVRKLAPFLVIASLILCALPFLPGIGVEKNGARRWISIVGHNFQPSELAKMALPLYLAYIFDKKQEKLHSFVFGILPPVLITAFFCIVIYLQNSFSIALFIALNALVIFFLAGVKLRYFLGAAFIVTPLSIFSVVSKEHRLKRFLSFVWPNWEPDGSGYQVDAAIKAIRSGGFWGKGLGLGTRKISSIPEIHSDFIFASFGEEFGFVGVLLFFLLLGFFTIRGYRTALAAEDNFRRLLVFGLVTMISFQAVANIGVAVGALPVTGVPLPFFSAGGSSLVVSLSAAGLIVNVSRHRKKSEVLYV